MTLEGQGCPDRLGRLASMAIAAIPSLAAWKDRLNHKERNRFQCVASEASLIES